MEAGKKFHTQIRTISLNHGTPYETLHAYISNAVSPYLKSYLKKGYINHFNYSFDCSFYLNLFLDMLNRGSMDKGVPAVEKS